MKEGWMRGWMDEDEFFIQANGSEVLSWNETGAMHYSYGSSHLPQKIRRTGPWICVRLTLDLKNIRGIIARFKKIRWTGHWNGLCRLTQKESWLSICGFYVDALVYMIRCFMTC